jgi:predicted MFS family arabinose efflux permease
MSETNNPNQEVSPAYKNYVLMMLTLVYVFNFIDRQILVILQESIKVDLGLSDTQLGLLSGFTFAIFYVTVGIPIARLADKSNRKNIVAGSLAIWSAMTALSGMAHNFWQLLLARIGVGVGEAGGSPPAHAMISDYFEPEKRATALSIYSTGIYFGVLLGFPLGGWLNAAYGWRIAFLGLGLPGVLFAMLFYFTVKEPLRVKSKSTQSTDFKNVVKFLFAKKSFVFLACATGLHTFCTYGLGGWIPSFLVRVHGVSIESVSLWLGLIIGLGGAGGTYFGGYLADKLGKKDKTWYFKVSAYSALISIPFSVLVYFSSSLPIILTALVIVYICYSMFLGPSIAITHTMVPPNMRAFSSAILFFVLNLIGLGFGPLVIGMISDALIPSIGNESLRWALSSTVLVSSGAVFLFLKASKYINADLEDN